MTEVNFQRITSKLSKEVKKEKHSLKYLNKMFTLTVQKMSMH